MFKIERIAQDRQMMVTSVAPPSPKQLDRQFQDLSNSHIKMYNNESFAKYINLLQNADDQQIEHGRLQWQFFIKEVEEMIHNDFLDHSYFDITSNPEFHDLLLHFTQVVQNNVKSIQEDCNDKSKLMTLNTGTETLVEGIAMLNMLYDKINDSNWQQKVSTLMQEHQEVIARHKGLEALMPNYANYKDYLQKFDDIASTTHARLEKQLSFNEEFNFSDMYRTDIVCGDRNYLWNIVQNAQFKEQEMQKRYYRELDDYDCEFVRNTMVNSVKAWERYHAPGMVSILFSAGTVVSYEAYRRRDASMKTEEDLFANEVANVEFHNKRSFKVDQEPLPQKEERMPIIIENKKFNNDYSVGINRIFDNIKHGFGIISEEMGLNNHYARNLSLPTITILNTSNDDVRIGNISDDANKKILIYKQDNIAPGAINTFMVPVAIIEQGFPEVETLFDKDYSLSSFYNFADFISNMQDGYIQEHILGKSYLIIDKTSLDVGETIGKKRKIV